MVRRKCNVATAVGRVVPAERAEVSGGADQEPKVKERSRHDERVVDQAAAEEAVVST